MASNQEEAIKRAIRANGGKLDGPAVAAAYNAYVVSMTSANVKAKPLESFK